MTIEEAREEIPCLEVFEEEMCTCCRNNDWYCPDLCDERKKAIKLDFERIQKSYARNDGDMVKVVRFIKQARI